MFGKRHGDIFSLSEFALHPLLGEAQKGGVIVLGGFLRLQPTIESILAGVQLSMAELYPQPGRLVARLAPVPARQRSISDSSLTRL